MYEDYVCSNCGARASYDGRCGDGPYLTCECVSQKNSFYVPDRCGGYTAYYNNPEPIPARQSYKSASRRQSNPTTEKWDDWGRDDD